MKGQIIQKFLPPTVLTLLNNKVDKVVGKQLSTEDYTTAEKTKLGTVATNANNYSHPATHPASIIVQDANNRFMTDVERNKLSGIAVGATNYQHPANHAPSIISQDANNRFVTDSDKAAWDGKASFKSGSGTFPAGTTYTVTDAFITASTLVTVSPTAEKQGGWSVNSANGSFTITSDTAETTGVTFDWGAVK